MTDPRRFSKPVMREAYIRANGNCEACTVGPAGQKPPLRPGRV